MKMHEGFVVSSQKTQPVQIDNCAIKSHFEALRSCPEIYVLLLIRTKVHLSLDYGSLGRLTMISRG